MSKLYDVVNDDGIFIATRLSESTARHLAGCQIEETGVYHSVEPHNWELSKDAREFVGSGEDLETAERNAFEETRANGDGSPQWLARGFFNRPISGDEYAIQTRSAGADAYAPAFTDWEEIMEQQESIAADNIAWTR